MILSEADKAQYNGIPARAHGSDFNPFPLTLLQVHLRHEHKNYMRRGNMKLAVEKVLTIIEDVEREGRKRKMYWGGRECRRAFMITTAVRDALRLDLTPEHREDAMLVQKQRDYTKELKEKTNAAQAVEARGEGVPTPQEKGKKRAATSDLETPPAEAPRRGDSAHPRGTHQYPASQQYDFDEQSEYDDPPPPKRHPLSTKSSFNIHGGSHVWHLTANQSHNTIYIHGGTNYIYLTKEMKPEAKHQPGVQDVAGKHAVSKASAAATLDGRGDDNGSGKHAPQDPPPVTKPDKGKRRADQDLQQRRRSAQTSRPPSKAGRVQTEMSEKERLRPRHSPRFTAEHDKKMRPPPPLSKSRRSESCNMYIQKPRHRYRSTWQSRSHLRSRDTSMYI